MIFTFYTLGCKVNQYETQAMEQELIRRIGDFSKRGILFREGETFSDLYRERAALYARYADVAVSCEEPELLQSAEKIVLALGL